MTAATVGTALRSKVDRPETVAQVHEHERQVKRYRAAGLCTRCAAQAGYGHQLGFPKAHPPCPACAPLVSTFPIPKAGGWRALTSRWGGAGVGAGAGPTTGRGVDSRPRQWAQGRALVAA